LGKRKPWDSGKFGWSRFDQDVVGVRRWRVRCGLPTTHPEPRRSNQYLASMRAKSPDIANWPTFMNAQMSIAIR
jgi:hypothetical protein